MVKIAIAGGSSNVVQEIIDVLFATGKHDIILLSRQDAPSTPSRKGIAWIKVDYHDAEQLVKSLEGVHTLLSFVAEQGDINSPIQKALIDAAVGAGVRRFAPSNKKKSAGLDHLSWYTYKNSIRQYLALINANGKILEYTLIQPGLFTNYLTSPHSSAPHFHQMEIPISFSNRRALILEGGEDDIITLTTIQDLAQIVARIVEYGGDWPERGGIIGSTLSIHQVISLGEKIRGAPFTIERLKAKDLANGTWTSSWVPVLDHPSIPIEQLTAFTRIVVAGMLLAMHTGAYHCSDEWNRLLPEYKFTQAEEFLEKEWRGKD